MHVARKFIGQDDRAQGNKNGTKKGSRFLSKIQGIVILLEDYASGKYIRIPKSTVAYVFQHCGLGMEMKIKYKT